MHTRRDICGSLTLATTVSILPTIAWSRPIFPDMALSTEQVVLAQAIPPLPNIPNFEEFAKFLMARFMARAASRETKVAGDASGILGELISKSAIVFEREETGPIDRTKNFRILPLPVRQVIAVRNLDTIADIAIVMADRDKEKVKEKIITRAILQGVTDFLCPMYPFCVG
jgi:hypothetical protein